MKHFFRLIRTIIGDYPGERQIRQSISCLYGNLAISCVGIIFAVFSWKDALMYVIFVSIVLSYGLLAFRNDRVTYDEEGITLYNLWGKPFQINWNEIRKIDVVEEPLISRHLATGRVLRIHCVEKKDAVIIYRYPYKYYVFIDDFLSFASSEISEYCMR